MWLPHRAESLSKKIFKEKGKGITFFKKEKLQEKGFAAETAGRDKAREKQAEKGLQIINGKKKERGIRAELHWEGKTVRR